ncbi:MAG: ribonuclease HII [Micavibrio sp.]|nr:MAG: ribonuclease HII [Micavibrio sp.]
MSLKSSAKPSKPDFSLESAHNGPVCGLDEVGRGPLAGPVVASCVYIPKEKRGLDFVPDIRDSKKLSSKKLEYLFDLISEHFTFGIAEISPQEIDEINILQASLKAMENAYSQLIQPPAHALIDGNHIPKNLPCPAQPVIKGDSKSVSIAAASILAKVTRDRLMRKLAEEHPHYGWERNVGYPSREHLDAIDAHGITPHHRRSYAPVRNFLEHGATKTQRALAS